MRRLRYPPDRNTADHHLEYVEFGDLLVAFHPRPGQLLNILRSAPLQIITARPTVARPAVFRPSTIISQDLQTIKKATLIPLSFPPPL